MLLPTWLRWRRTPPAPSRRQPTRPRLGLERLEDRSVPSVNPLDPINGGFNGMAFPDTAGYVPPDTIAAVGRDRIVEAVNTSLAIYDKAGAVLQAPKSLQTFFGSIKPTQRLSDPTVIYDEMKDRFVVGVLDFGSTTFDLAVSKTAMPTLRATDWEMQKINLKENSFFGPLMADYPRLGYNGDAYVVSFNMFNALFGFYDHVQVVGINKESVIDGNPSTLKGFRIDRPGSGTNPNFTLTPAAMHNGPSNQMWFVEEAGYGNGQVLDAVKMTYSWTGSGATGVKFFDYKLGLPVAAYYTQPPAATQPPAPGQTDGGLIETNDARILNAAWRDNRLVAAQTVGEGDSLAHARFYEIDTSATSTHPTPTLTQWGDATPGQPGANTYFPSIEIGPHGSLGMTFMESVAASAAVPNGEYMSMYITGQFVTDRATGGARGFMQPAVRVAEGVGNYNAFDGSPYRAGDYSGISVDPNPADPSVDTFWAANEFATAAATNNWGTRISGFTVTATSQTSVAPTTASTPLLVSPGMLQPPPPDQPLRLGETERDWPTRPIDPATRDRILTLVRRLDEQLYTLMPLTQGSAVDEFWGRFAR